MATLSKSTRPERAVDIERAWHLVDGKDAVVGRLATKVAGFLIGKHKPSYVSYLDCGDYVVVINARDVVMTGKKESTKEYTRYSGYPSGLKTRSVAQMRRERPQEIVRHAVWGMVPKNKLRKRRMRRLHIYADQKHPYGDKLTVKQVDRGKRR